MPVNACRRAVRKIVDDTVAYATGAFENLKGARTIFKRTFNRSQDFIRSLGPTGEVLADQVEEVGRRALVRNGVQWQQLRIAMKGLSLKERTQIAQFLNKRTKNIDPALRPIADNVRKVLDRDMNAYAQLGGMRTMFNGQKVTPKGSGKPFPQVPNAQGEQVLRASAQRGLGHPKVAAAAQRMVAEGLYPDAKSAVAALQRYQRERVRAVNGYLQLSRVELPRDLVEWDPMSVLPGTIERNAFTLEGMRRWGPEFDGLSSMIRQLGDESGADHARSVGDFLNAHFGVNPAQRADARVAGAFSNFETVSKLSGMWSWLLNFGQQFTATARHPISVQLKALRDLPPIAQNFMRSSKAINEAIERTGAVSGRSTLTELTKQTKVGKKISDVMLAPFTTVAKSNEARSAWVARLAIERDIKELIRLEGQSSTLGRVFDSFRSLAVDPKGATRRRIEDAGIDPAEAMSRFQKGGRLSPLELAAVMQRATENEQFALNMLTTPIWWTNQPWLRLAFKFKTFSVRQTGFIWKNAVREGMLGNFAPGLKIFAALAIMGEAYHLARDQVEDSDRSLTRKLQNTAPEERDAQLVAASILANIAAQGGLGIIADLEWGLADWAFGPAGGTISTIGTTLAHFNQDPKLGALAVKEALRDEIVPLRQAQDIITSLTEEHDSETARFRLYHRLRGAAFEWERGQEEGTLPGELTRRVDRMLQGTPSFPISSKTLRYEYAARAVTAGSVDDATEFLTDVLSAAESRDDLDKLFRGAQSSRRSRAPMGNLNEEQRTEFLRTLSPEMRRDAVRIRREWIRDYDKALKAARTTARRSLRQGR